MEYKHMNHQFMIDTDKESYKDSKEWISTIGKRGDLHSAVNWSDDWSREEVGNNIGTYTSKMSGRATVVYVHILRR